MTPEDIAEQLVTEWQKEGRMPQMSWDFRGFAAAAAKMGADAERERIAKAFTGVFGCCCGVEYTGGDLVQQILMT